MDKIKLLIQGREENTYSIHYACSGFYYGGAIAPSICAISLVNLRTKEVYTFALHNYIIQGKSLIESEQQLLVDFVNFYKSLNNPIFIHWAMDSLEYGFKAIFARAENFGIYDFDLGKMQDINLNNLIDYNLGDFKNIQPKADINLNNLIDYNLIKSLEINNCKQITVMNGKDEAICFNKRDFNLVKLFIEGKVYGILNLFEKYISNDLVDYDIVY